jgi:Icc-related predicted phosphoesterase
MKILAVADIHGSQYRLNIILKNIENYSPELVIICGDITQFGPGELAKNFLNQIPTETLAITGNIDTPDVEKSIDESKAINIELKKIVKKGISFIGINERNQDDFRILNEKNLLDENSILVSHKPPYGAQDKIFIGMHGGSKELREIIDKYKPRLVLCGHIHEDPGFTKIGETFIVNCSMGKRGDGALLEINKDISVKMLD